MGGLWACGGSTTPEDVDDCPADVDADFCEAVGSGSCYYVDPVSGDDANAGSHDAPWRSLVNVNTTIYSQYNAPGWVGLHPGDVVYLKTGVYQTLYQPGDDGGSEGGGSFIFYVRGVHGEPGAPVVITRFPGHHPIFDPDFDGRAIQLAQSSHLRVSGIEVRNAYNRGIRISESEQVVVEQVVVHGTDGTVADNVAGLEVLSSTDVEVADSVFYDNYDRSAAAGDAQTHNSCNLVLFSNAGAIVVRDSVFYQTGDRTGPASGCGLKYKHASRDQASTFELARCYFENHKYFAIGIGTAHAHIHHNVINGAPVAITSQDHGGPTHQNDQLFEHNTIYDARAFYLSPTLDWVDHDGGPWPGLEDIVFRANVVEDLTDDYNSDRQLVNLNSYMSDELYLALAPAVSFEDNCYYNPNAALSFGFAGAESFGALGGYYDLAGWQEEYGFDSGSQIAEPLFHNPEGGVFGLDSGSPCAALGAYANGEGPATNFWSLSDCR